MEKKKRDFAWIIGLNLAMFVLSNVFSREEYHLAFPPKSWVFPMILLVQTGNTYFLYRVTSNFIPSKIFRFIYSLLLISQFFLTAYSVRDGNSVADAQTTGSIGFLTQLITYSIILVVILRDMFRNKHHVDYSLLAATTVYLFIPVLFGYIFTLLSLYNPSLVGLDGSSAQKLISICFETSQLMAVGFDIPETVNRMIKSLGVLEATVMNLYIVFVVGKLLVNHEK